MASLLTLKKLQKTLPQNTANSKSDQNDAGSVFSPTQVYWQQVVVKYWASAVQCSQKLV